MGANEGNSFFSRLILGLCLLFVAGCISNEKKGVQALGDFETFYRSNADSIAVSPRRMRTLTLQKMRAAKDSLEWYNYSAIVLKTCMFSSDMDSAYLLIRQMESFCSRQPASPQIADLQSEYNNVRGNIYARIGDMDSAASNFRNSYEQRMKGTKLELVPDILINLADAYSRQGKYDVGAAWYRRALLLCDSLELSSQKQTPIYYGLAQVYMALRDFDQCDHYYNLAAKAYDAMLPYEQHIYLNNRGNSYYYREDYPAAIPYFRKGKALAEKHSDMTFELNLSRLNLGDTFLQMAETDSAAKYLNECQPFFQELGAESALYYIDTQNIALALKRKDVLKARKLLADAIVPSNVEPDMLHIRNKYLQQFYEETANYKQAYFYQKENQQIDDSIRNERVKMRTADLALHYQQDSTLMAQNVLIQKKENELLELQQVQFIGVAFTLVVLLVSGFLYLYNKKKRALLVMQNQRAISSLRLENIRNRLSPHFIFNVLNQEMVNREDTEQKELASLVKLMRRNLELAEQLCVSLSDELNFVQTYIDLERRSLGSSFRLEITIDEKVDTEQVLLPSMLIQIPVENAVKHALRGKDGERRLWIDIRRFKSGVCIKITDNGGGFRPDSRNKGTGTGMRVVMQTIQILNTKNKEGIGVVVHDVALPEGEVGCEVQFNLPENYDYNI